AAPDRGHITPLWVYCLSSGPGRRACGSAGQQTGHRRGVARCLPVGVRSGSQTGAASRTNLRLTAPWTPRDAERHNARVQASGSVNTSVSKSKCLLPGFLNTSEIFGSDSPAARLVATAAGTLMIGAPAAL